MYRDIQHKEGMMDITSMVSNARTQLRPPAPAVPFTGRLPSQPPEGVTLSEGSAEEMEKSMQITMEEMIAARANETFVYSPTKMKMSGTYIVDIKTGEAIPDRRTSDGIEKFRAFLNLNGEGAEYRAANAAWLDLKKKIAMYYPDIPPDFGFSVTEDKKIAITNGKNALTNDQRAVVEYLANQSKALVDSAVAYAGAMIDFVARDYVQESGVGKYHLDFSTFKKTIDMGLIFNTDEIGRQQSRAGHVGTAKNPLTIPGFHSNLWMYQLQRNGEVRYKIEEREEKFGSSE